MLEQLWNQGLGKFLLVQDYKRVSILRPSNEVLVLTLLEKAVQRLAVASFKYVTGQVDLPAKLLNKWRYLLALRLGVSLGLLGQFLQHFDGTLLVARTMTLLNMSNKRTIVCYIPRHR